MICAQVEDLRGRINSSREGHVTGTDKLTVLGSHGITQTSNRSWKSTFHNIATVFEFEFRLLVNIYIVVSSVAVSALKELKS